MTVLQPNVNMVLLLILGIKKADLDQDLPLVNEFYGLIDHTSGREDIAPSVLGERYKYNIHLAYGIVG
ncbi:hypothetical protein CMK17_01565 [Candidatus Poribacteria bacterium]|jgi:hypothetical protein|nr:hypothetical protein [Candidatus Poribacteria bacterium]